MPAAARRLRAARLRSEVGQVPTDCGGWPRCAMTRPGGQRPSAPMAAVEANSLLSYRKAITEGDPCTEESIEPHLAVSLGT